MDKQIEHAEYGIINTGRSIRIYTDKETSKKMIPLFICAYDLLEIIANGGIDCFGREIQTYTMAEELVEKMKNSGVMEFIEEDE